MASGIPKKTEVDKGSASPQEENPNSTVADNKLLSGLPTDTESSLSLPVVQISQSTPETRSWKGHARQLWKWTPPPARYDPDNPPKFTVWINLLFAFVSRPDIPPEASLTPPRPAALPCPTSTTTKPCSTRSPRPLM